MSPFSFIKAFDTVDYQILLKCLTLIGCDEKSCNWFASYFSNRSQAVVVDGYQSSFMNVNKGVPQGSI